jgi:hypothetical protein
MPTNTFDILDHLDQEVGWVILFPSSRDWTQESKETVVKYMQEVMDTFVLVSTMRLNRDVTAANVRYRTIQHLCMQIPLAIMNNLAQEAASYARKIEGYIERYKAS